MKKHKGILIVALLLLFVFPFAFGQTVFTGYFGNYSLQTFNTSNPSEVVVMDGSTNQTLYISLPKYSNVTSASINITTVHNLTNFRFEVGTLNNSPDLQATANNTPYPESLDPFGAQGVWHLNESAGTVVEASLGTNATALNIEDSDWQGGKYGNSLNIDGVNEEFELDSTDHGGFGSCSAYAISTWIKGNATTGTLMGANGAGTMDHQFYLTNSGADLAVESGDFSLDHIIVTWHGSGTSLMNNNWNHLFFNKQAGCGPSSLFDLYINGVNQTSRTINVENTMTNLGMDALHVGSRGDTGFTAMLIDEFVLFINQNMSTGHAQTIYYGNYTLPGSVFNGTTEVKFFERKINSYLNNCTPNIYGLCEVPINLYSTSAGNVTLNMNNTVYYGIKYNYTYEAETIEKDEENYVLTLFDNLSSATFIHNNSYFTPSVQRYPNSAVFTASAESSWIAGDVFNATYPILWNFTDSKGTSFNTSTSNQTVHKIVLDQCETYTLESLNFTIKEENTELHKAGPFSSFFEVWHDSKFNKRNYTFDYTGNSSYTLCLYPRWVNYTADSQIEYSATGYSTKNYYFSGFEITNSSQLIKLYVSNGTTQVKFTVTDFNDNPVQGAIVKVLSYNLGTNTYTTTEILEADSDGDAYGQIVLDTRWYQFIVEYNGIPYLQTLPTKITSTTKKFRIDLDSDYYLSYDTVMGMSHSLVYTNETQNYAATWSEPTGESVQVCLRVVRRTSGRDTQIADTCQTSSSGTILVNVNETVGKKTYIASSYVVINGKEFLLDTITRSFDYTYKTFGKSGIFVGFLLTLALVCATLFDTTVALTAMAISFLFVNMIGFAFLNWYILIAFILSTILNAARPSRK
jgi:hypothetical protein